MVRVTHDHDGLAGLADRSLRGVGVLVGRPDRQTVHHGDPGLSGRGSIALHHGDAARRLLGTTAGQRRLRGSGDGRGRARLGGRRRHGRGRGRAARRGDRGDRGRGRRGFGGPGGLELLLELLAGGVRHVGGGGLGDVAQGKGEHEDKQGEQGLSHGRAPCFLESVVGVLEYFSRDVGNYV